MKPIIWFFYMMNETFNGTYFQKKRSQFGLSTQFLKWNLFLKQDA